MNKPRLFAMATGAVFALSCSTLSAYAATQTSYTVKPGDTVWKIAHANHLSVSQISQWNHLQHPSLIYPGTRLMLSANHVSSGNAQSSIPSSFAVRNFRHAPVLPSRATVSAPVVKQVTAASPTVNRNAIVSYAKNYLGVPYQWGGHSSSGFDCSGLVQTVYGHFHVDLPRMAAQQEQVGSRVSKSQLQPGDLVFFNTTGPAYSHVGIYIGNNDFISATTSHGVTISSLDNPYYWGPRFTGATNPLS